MVSLLIELVSIDVIRSDKWLWTGGDGLVVGVDWLWLLVLLSISIIVG